MKKLVGLLLMVGVTKAQVDTLRHRVENLAGEITGNAASIVSSGVVSNAGCRGGFPHFNVGIAVNMSWFKFANPLDDTKEVMFPAFFPYLYGELGIFKGFSFTPLLNGILAVDILGKYAPTLIKSDYFEEIPNFLAYGVKIQILKDQLVPPTPAVSVTIINNVYKPLTFKFDTLHTSLSLNDLGIRAAVSKNFVILTPYAGVGYDTYTLKTTYWTDGDPVKKSVADVKDNVIYYFGGLEFKFLVIKGYLEGLYRNSRVGVTLGVKAGI
ncbi:MAG: hypothetical protein ABIM43_03325 [candidate division WOR-3 bacterium]